MKWLFYFLGFAALLALLVLASPLIALLGGGATYYFWKKQPDASKRNISALVTIVALFTSFLLLPSLLKKDETKKILPVQSTSSISFGTTVKESTQLEVSTEVSNTESTQTESISSSQEVKNDGPEYTDDSNILFANYLTDSIQSKLSESGVDFTIKVKPLSNDSVYVTVPQEIKYFTKGDLQRLVDNVYNAKNMLFKNWAIENGYDLGFTSSPVLFVQSEDGTILAEESILFGGMKVKVKN